MELRHLRYFVAVAEERHFGRAADRLQIAQPGLSQQIKALERSLGVKLFERSPRRVEVTPAGDTLLQHAYVLLELVDRAIETTRSAAAGEQSPLKVGTVAAGIDPVATEVLDRFRERFPQVRLELHPGHRPQSVEALSRRALDLTFVTQPSSRPPDGTGYLRLGTIEPLVVLPEGHRLAPFERIPRDELLSEPFIAMARSVDPLLIDQIYIGLFGIPDHPDLVEPGDDTEATRMLLVKEGKGLTATAFRAIEELQIAGLVFRRVEEPVPVIEHGILWHEEDVSPFVSQFVEVARLFAEGSEGSKLDRRRSTESGNGSPDRQG